MTPRQKAIEKGNARYFTGKPCPYGHLADRFVSSRVCCQCAAERAADWQKSNPEKNAEQKRRWVAANPERAKQLKAESQKRNRDSANRRNRKWQEANREQSRAATKRWAEENPGKALARASRYRASKLHATPVWADHARIVQTYECAAALRSKGLDVEVDHILPLQGEDVCGLHVSSNLQIISMPMNRSKSNRSNYYGL